MACHNQSASNNSFILADLLCKAASPPLFFPKRFLSSVLPRFYDIGMLFWHTESLTLHFTSLLFDHHYRITHIDQRLCSVTMASTEKWNSLFERSLKKLGFQHGQQQSLHSENTLSIWNYWHLVSSQSKSSSPPVEVKSKNSPFKRSNSLPGRFRFNKNMTVHQSSSHPIPPPELKKSNGEQLQCMMKEYLEKVRSLCTY